ncbi:MULTISPECIES: molybdopterin-dependent oxidoreductase [unclassified Streptomyces]|uniref:molybdopterin-dependent oxidoreductase n=1 Tax=unclassified Streptomyces TaxID=2593676 RepID=UPI0006BF7C4D|nr:MULTISPECIES: molybdopterin-dependent oxidoreductase [unclassified Streptomyces]KOX24452.1 molybdopterin-dependent oxidoreductase [Streptomyces sp. NRRL F-6491]KOX43360.1 molybdopterin-dependent oxidoreductase [Streptomyces sp. NRRL F-6492]
MSRPNTAPHPTPAAAPAPTRTPAPASVPAGSFTLRGDVARPATLTVADLRRDWEQHRVEVVFDCATAGPQHHTFSGPLLREVATAARPRFDPARRKERSRFLIAVDGGDGHHALLSWAEIDADFGDAPVLLATRMDDRDLDGDGPQLVVPSDRCGARYVSAVTGIWIGSARLAAPLPSGT